MSDIWYAFIRFLKKLFTTPELTAFERFLVDEVHNLEAKLNRVQQEKNELYERLLFGNSRPEPVQEDLTPLTPPLSSTRSRLEQAAKKRADDAAAEFIRRQEEKMAEDSAKARVAESNGKTQETH